MVKRSRLPELEIKSGYGEIRFAGGMARVGPRIQVVSSEAGGEDGAQPTLALIDELHRHRDGDLYGVFRDGLPKRRGSMLTISTAGATMDSPLGRLRAKALEHPDVPAGGDGDTRRGGRGSPGARSPSPPTTIRTISGSSGARTR